MSLVILLDSTSESILDAEGGYIYIWDGDTSDICVPPENSDTGICLPPSSETDRQ